MTANINDMVYTRTSRRAKHADDDDEERPEVSSTRRDSNTRRRRRAEEEDDAADDGTEKSSSDRYRRRMERERYFTQAVDTPTISSATSSPSVSSNMRTTAAGNKLAQEIHEEFLTCKICLEGFKSPKCLDCLHTFCEQCIDNHVLNECSYKKYSDYREVTCPLCRKRTQLPVGGVKKLPDNILVSSLGEVVARQKTSKYPFCDICKLVSRKHREATNKCLECNKLLCKHCVDLHRATKVTQNHSIFDVEIEKDIECKEHQDEVVRFYCEPCQTCICVLCTFNEHKDHEITQFTEAVSKYKDNIQELLGNCKCKIDVYDRQIALLNKCEGIIKGAEQRIRDSALSFIAEIRSREKTLIDELHGCYGSELMQFVNKKGEMQNNLDGLKSTCNLTELVLKGKDIELLLLKKQVEEKLSVLASVELKDLPRSVGKQICFVPGVVELGKLEDPDLPLEKKKGVLDNNDCQRFALSNLAFDQKCRDRDIISDLQRITLKKTAVTQTDIRQREATNMVPLANKCVQTEFPFPEIQRDSSTCSSNGGSYGLETRATETDVIYTREKAVNTRSRGLQHSNSQLQHEDSREESPTACESSTSMDAAAARRLRRRRERVKPIEVSVRPTTNYFPAGQSQGPKKV